MNQNQKDTLLTCLTQVFGRVEESFVEAALPLLEWVDLPGGETLMREGDPATGVYFVISGRLRASVEQEGVRKTVGEIGRGETVGEMGILTGEPRSATVTAIRDSVLAHASREAFEILWHRHPQLPVHMARIIIERLKRSSVRKTQKHASTFCVLPVTDGVDARSFAEALARALDRWVVATVESRERIDARFGSGAAETTERDSDTYHRVSNWMDDVEFWNEIVLLVADRSDSGWTRRCLRHADEVLLVARADATPQLDPVEEKLFLGEKALTGARQTLVLLHEPATRNPSGTVRWLDRRPVDAHLHIRLGHERDMARLARIVSGNAIGIVLAGGGARGFAHLGVYKALEEAGIEVDYVGGTSIGGVMAAYVALDRPADELIESGLEVFGGNPTGDLNLIPFVSLISGRRIHNRVIRGVDWGTGSLDSDIADNWRTLFCIASNYSDAREMVITRGSEIRALRATMAIPVALPPVMWDGELLIDGGVFNNFPTDVMAKMSVRKMIGVDLARKNLRRHDFEDVPGTWQLLLDRLRPRRKRKYRLPSLGAVLMGTTVLYSESRRTQAAKAVDLYINPNLAGISLMDWKSYRRIVQIGYRDTKELLASLSEADLAPYRNARPELRDEELTA